MFVLDTNVVSELRKTASGRADANVVSWASSASAGAMYVSAMTMFELELGILMMERRDPAQGGILRSWMTQRVLPAFAGRVLAIDSAVAFQCAKLHMPNQRSERDAMIAATALVHGMSVVTRNLDDFQGTGATLINPWLP
jgi:predicted nucleic acid-binding protein